MKRRWMLIIVLALAALGAGWLIFGATRPRAPGASATVYRGNIKATLDCLGSVQVRRQMSVSALISGRVTRIDVLEGDRVVSGTLLLELSNPDAQTAVEQAQSALTLRELELDAALKAPDQASIDLAVARLRQATVLRQRAQDEYDAIRDQPDAGSSDEAVALEAAKLEYQVAQAQYDQTMAGPSELQLEQLRANLADAQRSLESSRLRLRQLSLYAPMDGTVMQINTRVGENVYAYNALVQLADLSTLEVRADVNELDIAAVVAGQAASLSLDAFPGVTFAGQITSILPSPSSARGMTAYTALVAFQPGDSAVRPGMGANVTITTKALEDVLLIPRRAVRSVGPNQVVRRVTGRRVEEVVVVMGLSNASEVQVVSGLEEGQVVLID